MSWIVGLLAAEAHPTHPIVAAMVVSAVFASAFCVLFAWTRDDAIKDTERIERRAHMDSLINHAQAEANGERLFLAERKMLARWATERDPESNPKPEPKLEPKLEPEPKPVDFKNPPRKERDIL